MAIDRSWDALVGVTGVNPTIGRGELNYALGQIRKQTEHLDVDDGELALLIHHRAKLYRQMFPELPLTPPALAKWWDRLEQETERLAVVVSEREVEEKRKSRRATNVQHNNGCVTCGGDHWVVVGFRAATKPTTADELGHEQTAPCPVCNLNPPIMKNFWDGRSWEYGSRPGELRI